MPEQQPARSALLAGIHRALDDPWIAAVHASEARQAQDDARSAELFRCSGQALTAVGRLVATLIRWGWAPEYAREEIEADIAAWAAEIRDADGSWDGRFTGSSPRYRWRVPFADAGARVLDQWLAAVVNVDDLPPGPIPPGYEDLSFPPSSLPTGDPEAARQAVLAVLDERLERAVVWPDPIPTMRATRTRDAVLAASTALEVEAAWQLGEGLLYIDDSWNAGLCAALLSPIEALLDDEVDAAAQVRDELLGPGAGSTAYAASVLHDRLVPNVADPGQAAGARLGEAGFEALVALRASEAVPDLALLRPGEGESMVRRWDDDCPIDSSVWADISEPGVIR